MNARWRSSLRAVILLSCLWLLIFWIGFSPIVRPAQASITLTYFTASWQNDDVLVAWETAAEEDIESFYIQRSDSQNGTYTRISMSIPSIGNPQSGATYQFIDTNATSGVTYWYRLESIENVNNSEVSVYYEPVASLLSSLTPTVTKTGTLENTPTHTTTLAVSPTASLTPTVTGTSLSSTGYPAPITVTPPANLPTSSPSQPTQSAQPLLPTTGVLTATETPSATAILSPTETLIPLPDITLIFPPGGIVIQERGTSPATPAPASQSASAPGWNPYGGVMLISVIVVIWILLGSWFYLSFRKIE